MIIICTIFFIISKKPLKFSTKFSRRIFDNLLFWALKNWYKTKTCFLKNSQNGDNKIEQHDRRQYN